MSASDERGRILVAEQQGLYDIKFIGDVRMVLCTSLSDYIESIFQRGDASEVLVDLLEASGVDSTTLGLLAKLAIHCNRQFGLRPKLFCDNDGINHTLKVMGLDEVFDLFEGPIGEKFNWSELQCGDLDEDTCRQRVLEAHRQLIELNPANRDDFIDLIRSLEKPV
ncbi:STAS domain-containing protein [Porticoccus sp. W117]|uniref:STAS domain-containing protein n=1 Tax=Porticoccus sp. W117 TaxID=3054777 RepID=UPI0025995A90|nr:STAS domain-containing protein [Porticoccus sp. W117]MDM3870178.1 STAS domain-containing protein [Porticoccus sp. W117]